MSGLASTLSAFFSPRNVAVALGAIALLAVLCISFSPLTSLAQESGDGTTPTYDVTTQTTSGTSVTTNTATGETAPTAPEEEPRTDGDFLLDPIIKALAFIVWWVFTLFAKLMGIAGLVLNTAVNIFILDFGTTFAGSDGMQTAWEVLRDVANLVIIFGLVFLGLASIPQLANFEGKRNLAKLLIFAVLLNFSYFLTATAIDITNAVSTSIYKQAIPEDAACAEGGNENVLGNLGDSACATRVGISGAAFIASGLSGVLNAGDAQREAIADNLDDPGKEFVLYTLMTVFVAICAFVFASVAFLLFSRLIVLLFLLITSPIGFVSLALPQTEDLGHKWWKALIDNILYAPAALILLLIAIKIAGGINLGDGQLLLAAAMQGESIGIMGIMSFVVVMGLMLGSVEVAKNFSIFGSTTLMNTGRNSLKGLAWGGKAAAGGAAALGRQLAPKSKDEKPSRGNNGVSRARNALKSFNFTKASTPTAPARRDVPPAFAPNTRTVSSGRAQVNVRPVTPVQGSGGTSSGTASPARVEPPTALETKRNIERAVVVRQQMRNPGSDQGKLKAELDEISSRIAVASVGDGGSEEHADYILAEKERLANEERIAENTRALEELKEAIQEANREASESGGQNRTQELEQQRRNQQLEEYEERDRTYQQRRISIDTRLAELQTKLEVPEHDEEDSGTTAPRPSSSTGGSANDNEQVSSSQLDALFKQSNF